MDVLKGITSIEAMNLEGRRVFMRMDFDCPLGPNGKLLDDSRLHAALPTIRLAIEKGARLVLAAHLGHPRGKRSPELSMLRIGARLAELLDRDVYLPEEIFGEGPRKVLMERNDGDVVLLENLRFHQDEDADDDIYAARLADLADAYVNDCFATAGRVMTSTHAISKHLAEKGAGLLLLKELAALSRLLGTPEQPFVAIVGGARFSDKIGFMNNLMGKVKTIAIGGATAATFLAAKGVKVGRTRVEADKLEQASSFLARARLRGVEVLLPVDCIVAHSPSEETSFTVGVDAIPAASQILDIGPDTAAMFGSRVSSARTAFWNGPMGLFEKPHFMAGTEAIAKAIARSSAASVVGGEDTAAAVSRLVLNPFFRHVSMGGHAALEFLEGREMPAIDALRASE